MTMHQAVFLITLATATWAHAGEWPQWRGPFMNGTTDETDLPTRWSRTENIAWSVDLPGAAAATGHSAPQSTIDRSSRAASRCAPVP